MDSVIGRNHPTFIKRAEKSEPLGECQWVYGIFTDPPIAEIEVGKHPLVIRQGMNTAAWSLRNGQSNHLRARTMPLGSGYSD